MYVHATGASQMEDGCLPEATALAQSNAAGDASTLPASMDGAQLGQAPGELCVVA